MPTLAAVAILGDVDRAFFAAGRLYAVARFQATAPGWVGKTLAAIRDERQVLVVGLGRAGAGRFLPRLDVPVEKGDELMALGQTGALTEAARPRH
ncbi:MAG: TrkA C-terminal domain-containing protein [Ktedonobacterales bacterium]